MRLKLQEHSSVGLIHIRRQSAYLELPLDESSETASCSVTKAAGFTLTRSGSEGRRGTSVLAGAEEGGGGGGTEGEMASEVGLCTSIGLPDIAGELI